MMLQADLGSFHSSHFSPTSTEHFATNFLEPVEDNYLQDDDGLGYYSDGVKRTLTDEQIEIFRHSEIQALLRDQRYADDEQEAQGNAYGNYSAQNICTDTADVPVDEQSAEAGRSRRSEKQQTQATSKKGKKMQQQKKSFYKQHVKSDLRKRTWDKVETGLESLDYGEEVNDATPSGSASQRKQVSYDDD